MANNTDEQIGRLADAIAELFRCGRALSSSEYEISGKRERGTVPDENDYLLATSYAPLEGDNAYSLSWPNILRRLRQGLLRWWLAWDDAMSALPAIPDEIFSGAFGAYWSIRLRRLLIDTGGAVNSTRPPQSDWKGELNLSAFVFGRLPDEWAEQINQTANFVTELLAVQGSAPEIELHLAPEDVPNSNSRVTWQEAAERLLRIMNSGLPYKSRKKHADDLECSSSTVQAAITNTPALHGWASSNAADPTVSGLNKVIEDTQPQYRETVPANLLDDNDVELVMAKLIQEAKPEERATLNAMSPEKRRELAALVAADKDYSNKVWSRK